MTKPLAGPYPDPAAHAEVMPPDWSWPVGAGMDPGAPVRDFGQAITLHNNQVAS